MSDTTTSSQQLQAVRSLEAALAALPPGSGRADALRDGLGTEPQRAFDVASRLTGAQVFEGPTAGRRGVTLEAIVVLTDTSGGDVTPVLVMISPTAEHARAAASNWVGNPVPPVPLPPSRPSKPRRKAAPVAGTSAPPSTTLAPAVSKQIARLKGTLPAATALPASLTVSTPAGPCALSPALTTFVGVAWATDRKYVFGDPESTIHFGGNALDEHLAKDFDGPLIAIGYDDLQFFEVVRGDDTAADPLVYRIDHDGSSPLYGGIPLSKFLAGVKAMSTAPAKGVGPELLEAIRMLDAPRAVELVRRAGAKALVDLDRAGFTPLHYAAMAGLTDVVIALLTAGADPNAVVRAQMKFGKKLLGDTWGNGGRTAMKGETPLISALFEYPRPPGTARDTLGVVRALLEAGADPNRSDSLERTPLQIAARLPKTQDEIVTTLLTGGADPNACSLAIGSPLGNALTSFSLARVKAVLAAGGDPNRVTTTTVWEVKGATAIHMAARWGLAEELEILLDAGGNPNAPAGDGTLPLAHAKGAAAEVLRARGGVERAE